MTLKVLASDAQGALSEGDNSNPAFATPRVNNVAYVDIAPPEGYEHAEYIIPGVEHVALSLSEGSGYGAEGAALTVGAFSAVTRIYVKILSAADPAPKLVLPAEGFTEVTYAQGVAGSTSGVVGAVVAVQIVGGSAGSTSNAIGDVTAYTLLVEGVVGSTSGVVGAAFEVAVVAGIAGSTSVVTGAPTTVAETILASFDGTIAQDYPTTNFGTSNVYYIVGWYNSSSKERRSLVGFSLGGRTNHVASAQFRACVQGLGANGNGRTIRVTRCLRADVVEAQYTWTIYKTGSNWSTAGCAGVGSDYDDAPYVDNAASVAVNSWQEWDVTAIVNEAIDAGSTDILFRMATVEAYASGRQTQYYPRESGDSARSQLVLVD